MIPAFALLESGQTMQLLNNTFLAAVSVRFRSVIVAPTELTEGVPDSFPLVLLQLRDSLFGEGIPLSWLHKLFALVLSQRGL